MALMTIPAHFLEQNQGVQFIPFLYIGAKHMITGYDHLLFLLGVVFFLYRSKDVLLYVTMFTLGHSATLLFGVLSDIQVNAYLIDASLVCLSSTKDLITWVALSAALIGNPTPK